MAGEADVRADALALVVVYENTPNSEIMGFMSYPGQGADAKDLTIPIFEHTLDFGGALSETPLRFFAPTPEDVEALEACWSVPSRHTIAQAFSAFAKAEEDLSCGARPPDHTICSRVLRLTGTSRRAQSSRLVR